MVHAVHAGWTSMELELRYNGIGLLGAVEAFARTIHLLTFT